MNVVDTIAHVLKEEGVEHLFAYPLNPIIEAAAAADIRPVVVRQERVGVHMADAVSRLSSGDDVGVFCMQMGPGAENAFPGVAQAYADSVPVLVLPMGPPRASADEAPSFNASHNYREVTKFAEQVTDPAALPSTLRRAFNQLRNGRPGPALVEIPYDLAEAEVPGQVDYSPTSTYRPAPDPDAVPDVADALLDAERPVVYAGQGVHYAQAWEELREFAELLEAPVATSLQGKSAFPETHPLSLGAGGARVRETLHHFLGEADLVFGVGCSFTWTPFSVEIPEDDTVVHATLDPADVDKDVVSDHALVGDAKLTLRALLDEVGERMDGGPRGQMEDVTSEIEAFESEWLEDWEPRLDSDEVPLSPYRVIRDLMDTVDVEETIITHDSGSPRDELSPFWESVAPLSYIGWGKSTQLGYGLGLTLGAKLTHPDKLCVNVWGDAAIGMTGMDFETAVREDIPILSLLMNNFSMAMEVPHMPVSTEKYDATAISGNYADVAEALGGYGERVEEPDDVVPAIERGVERTESGTPALIEFVTTDEKVYASRGRKRE